MSSTNKRSWRHMLAHLRQQYGAYVIRRQDAALALFAIGELRKATAGGWSNPLACLSPLTAAVAAYGRLFTEGTPLHPEQKWVPREHAELHRELMKLRNNSVGHSNVDYRFVRMIPPGAKVDGFGTVPADQLTEWRALARLAKVDSKFVDAVETRLRWLEERLEVEARNKLRLLIEHCKDEILPAIETPLSEFMDHVPDREVQAQPDPGKAASDALRHTFRAFREQSIWTRTCFDTFAALFHEEHEPPDLLKRTAPGFFEELNIALAEYCRLQVCKLTDPAESRGGKSLTVDNLNQQLKKEGLMNQSIEGTAAALLRYRDIVKDSRNKVIAHADKATALAGQPIGEHDAEHVDKFLDDLQVYNDEVGNAVGEGPLDFTGTSGPGDVLDLLRFLRLGLAAADADQ